MHSNNCSQLLAMEKLQEPINSCFLEEKAGVESFEQQGFVNTHSLGLKEEEENQQLSTPHLEDRMPFLQMLLNGESHSLSPFKEPNLLALLSLQHLKTPWEPGSNFTDEAVDFHSPVKTETIPNLTPCIEPVNSELNPELLFVPLESESASIGSSSPQCIDDTRIKRKNTNLPPTTHRERKKRKRTKAIKNREEVENQRKSHIAIERNRRRQMNEFLDSLRFLTPPSYIQRGDQASIIGGAIDFVKELELLLQSLEAQKITRHSNEESKDTSSVSDFIGGISSNEWCASLYQNEEHVSLFKVEGTKIQNHVNLKVQGPRKLGKLLTAIILLEELRLTVLHLNVSSSQASAFYSFNLKMEDDCKLGSADEIAKAAHQIFNEIGGR